MGSSGGNLGASLAEHARNLLKRGKEHSTEKTPLPKLTENRLASPAPGAKAVTVSKKLYHPETYHHVAAHIQTRMKKLAEL